MTENNLQVALLRLITEWLRLSGGLVDGSDIDLLTLDTNLARGGLGIDGSDANDLLVYLCDKLGWKLGEDFDFPEYFINEGFDGRHFLSLLFPRFRRKPISIRLLAGYYFRSQP